MKFKPGQVFIIHSTMGLQDRWMQLRECSWMIDSSITGRVQDDARVSPVGPEPILDNAILDDMERLALIFISASTVVHPALEVWRNAIASNGEEMRDFWGCVLDVLVTDQGRTLDAMCRAVEFILSPELFTLIWEGHPGGQCERVNKAYQSAGWRYDAPLLGLCQAVVEYRRAGRPGMMEPSTMTVSESLGVAILQYHQRVLFHQTCEE